MGTVTTVGRTLDRNLSSVDEILQNGNNLFQGAERAYDPTYNWLDLNLATAPGVTGAYIAGLLRDRLAGICRRIVANHSTGLSAAVIATLNQCGNPSSGFFDPLLNDIPTILDTLSGGSGSATAQSLLQQGLTQIANAEQGANDGTDDARRRPRRHRRHRRRPPPRPRRCRSPRRPRRPRAVCSARSSAARGARAPVRARPVRARRARALGGLLSNQVTRGSSQPTATLAVAALVDAAASDGRPDADRPAAALLPPLPQDQRHHAHAHRGLLSGWVHDVEGWF